MSNQVVVPLRPGTLRQENPDWVAFGSALRSLWDIEDMPVEVLNEGMYAFRETGSLLFTAEGMLDEFEMCIENIRIKLQCHRRKKG